MIHHHSFKIHRNRQQQQQQLGGKKASQAEEDFSDLALEFAALQISFLVF